MPVRRSALVSSGSIAVLAMTAAWARPSSSPRRSASDRYDPASTSPISSTGTALTAAYTRKSRVAERVAVADRAIVLVVGRPPGPLNP